MLEATSERSPGHEAWCTLFAFSFNTGVNAMLFMDFVSVTSVSAHGFGIGEEAVGLTYSLGLWAALVTAVIASWALQSHSWTTFFLSPVFNVVAAWLRWIAFREHRFSLCIASTISIGISFGVCAASFAVIGERWFPPALRTLATTIAVQSNYAGWCASALLIPSVVHDDNDLESFLLVQAVFVSLALPLFLALHNERVAKPPCPAGQRDALFSSLRDLFASKHYCVQLLCYGSFGAIGFAVPAIQDYVLSRIGLTSALTKWTNFVFIIAGVVCGLAITVRTPTRPLRTIKATCALVPVSLVVLSALATGAAFDMLSAQAAFPILLLAMAGAGMGSIGFIGIALTEITYAAPAVSEAYSAGIVEMLVQSGGALLSQYALNDVGFWICAGVAAAAYVPLLFLKPRRADECASVEVSLNVAT